MLWILLRTFLAWGSARLIKKFLFKADFGKPIAIVLAVIWGVVWGIAAAFAFEYIFGEGTFNNQTLVPSIIFTSFAAYYAFIVKEFADSQNENEKPVIVLNQEPAQEQSVNEINPTRDKWFKKLLLVKSGTRALIALSVAFLLFSLVLATVTISVYKEWSIARHNSMNKSIDDQIKFCQNILDKANIDKVENCDKYLNVGTNNTDLLVNGMMEFSFCENRNKEIYAQNGCLVGNPGTLINYVWDSVQKSNFAIPLCLFVGILVFASLLTGRVLLLEKKLGWKRLSIVSGFTFAFIALIIIMAVADSFRSDELIALWTLTALLLIPLTTIILVLKGRLLFEWVKEGFREN